MKSKVTWLGSFAVFLGILLVGIVFTANGVMRGPTYILCGVIGAIYSLYRIIVLKK